MMSQPEGSVHCSDDVGLQRVGIPGLIRNISGGRASHGMSVGNVLAPQSMGLPSMIPGTLNVPPPILRSVTSSAANQKSHGHHQFQQHQIYSTNSSTHSSSSQDWRAFLSIEERQAVRMKIHAAYSNRCRTYEELLETAVAIEEELLHISAPSRLDYFKSGIEYESRVQQKRNQLSGRVNALDTRDTNTNRQIPDNHLPNKKNRM